MKAKATINEGMCYRSIYICILFFFIVPRCKTPYLSSRQRYSTGLNPVSATLNDFNNDTYQDIVVTNSRSNTLGIFLGRNDGTFEEMITFALEYGSQPFSLVEGDFNSDHKLDFAIANAGSDSLDILLQTC